MPDISATRPTAGAPIDTPWGQQVHDMLEGIQAGQVALVAPGTNIAPNIAVVFPRAYLTPPFVVVTCYTASGALVAFSQAPTTTGVVVGAGNQTGTGNVASQTVQIGWIAIGTLMSPADAALWAIVAVCLVLVGAILTLGPVSVEQRAAVLAAIFAALVTVAFRRRKE